MGFNAHILNDRERVALRANPEMELEDLRLLIGREIVRDAVDGVLELTPTYCGTAMPLVLEATQTLVRALGLEF